MSLASLNLAWLNVDVNFASVNDLELCYRIEGDPDGPVVLLVCGLGVQMIDWPDHFVQPLIDAGNRVVRYDNRDIGKSTAFDGAFGDPPALVEAVLTGQDLPEIAYTLEDMAADGAGLLDALGIDSAHVVGASMGGMIAQAIAIGHPNKVRSLTSIMSSTGSPEHGQPTPEAMEAILSVGPDERDARIEHGLKMGRVWASPDHFDEDELRAQLAASWDRVGGPQAANSGRQMCAILASAARDEALAGLTVPTLVVHGGADTLITRSGGEHTASTIDGAELLMIEGMGHDLPAAFVPQIVEAITRLIARAEGLS